MAYIGRGPTNSGEFIILDDISSGFDGSDTSFELTVGTAEVTPAAANVTIVLDGVLQTATSAYSVTGSTINFSEAPASGQEFHGVLAGQSQYISNNSITDDHISGTADISGSKINTDFSAQVIKGRVFAGMISGSDQVAALATMTLATASIAAITSSISRLDTEAETNESNMTLATASIAAITASLGQPVNTDSDVTFGTVTSGDITSTGTITAVEVHTTFVSSSIAVISGSNNFGDALDDHHSFTGSLSVSGSGTVTGSFTVNGDLVVKDNVDLEGDIDVNGTSNLDIVDIDGAVNMAADLTMGANILMADDTSIGIADDAERIEFDGAGDISVLGAQLLINQAASITIQGDNGLLQIASTDATAVQSLSKFSADANGFTLQFLKSRHATIGSNTIVQDDDTVGRIIFTAADGNDFGHASSEIRAQIDATPGTNEVPGRLVFLTTADGATGVTERMRIDSTGKVGIGTASPDYLVEIEKANGDHTSTALSITNTQAGGYGSSLNFVSERSDNNAHTIAARIRTQGNAAWNSDANTDSNLFFSTVVDNTLTDRMSISGTAGDVTVSTGNLVIGTSGKGIDFTAEAASTEGGTDRTASSLTDYEQGTWTPRGVDAVAATVTFANYTKIGRLVYVSCDVTLGSESGGGDQQISGLPFTSAGSGAEYGGVVYSSTNATASNDGTNPTFQLMAAVRPSETTFRLYFNVSGTTDELSQTQSSGKRFKISIFYSV